MRATVLLLGFASLLATLIGVTGCGAGSGSAPDDASDLPSMVSGKLCWTTMRYGTEDILTRTFGTPGFQRITDDPAWDRMPCWSPDGSKIAFVSDRDGNDEIYTMDADGSNVQRLTDYADFDWSPTWSPDGGKILFGRSDPDWWSIYEMDADGGNQTRVPLMIDAGCPAYSPDGQRIAFRGSVFGKGDDIYTCNRDASGLKRLTRDPASDFSPAWSPNGAKIAFVSDRDGNTEIYWMWAGGGNQTRLTNDPSDDEQPTWSPDGKTIVFSSYRSSTWSLWCMNAKTGANVRRLLKYDNADREANCCP